MCSGGCLPPGGEGVVGGVAEIIVDEVGYSPSDPDAASALVDRLVHHAEVLVLRGDSYRLRDKSKDVLGTDTTA